MSLPDRLPLADPRVQRALGSRRRSKFNARRTTVEGVTFDSMKEARRYVELRMLEQAGEVRELQMQVPFVLSYPVAKGVHRVIGKYVADFVYRRVSDGALVVEDVKGVRTPFYQWKKKHFEAQYGMPIQEV